MILSRRVSSSQFVITILSTSPGLYNFKTSLLVQNSLNTYLFSYNCFSSKTPVMTVKRKRSTSAFSPFSPFSSASESSSSSPQRPHTLPISHTYQDTDTTMGDTHPFYQIDNWAPAGDQTPSHLHSRTRKRFRDGRPGESIIHGDSTQVLHNIFYNTSTNTSDREHL